MGTTQSLPNFNFNIRSNCCITDENDEEDGNNMVQSRKLSRIWQHIKYRKSNENEQERNRDVAERSISI